jgi:hypothetical protein
MKIVHFVPIGLQTWPPHAILVSDWLISKKSSPLKLLSHMNQREQDNTPPPGQLPPTIFFQFYI